MTASAGDETAAGRSPQDQAAAATGENALERALTQWRSLSGPTRLLLTITFMMSLGFGLYVTGSTVYFVKAVGLSPSRTGLGLSLAALTGLIIAVPVGHYMDRHRSRDVTLALMMVQTIVLLFMTQVRSFVSFIPVIIAMSVSVSAAEVGRGALIAAVVGEAERAKLAVLSRSVFNAGFSVGLLGAGFAIGVGTRAAFVVLILGNAVTTTIAGLLYLGLPREAGVVPAESQTSGLKALKDIPFVLVAQVSSLTRLGDVVLTVGLPVWIVTHTSAPRQLCAWLIIVNTTLVVIFQVRASRGTETMNGAGIVQRRAMAAFVITCAIIGVSDRVSMWIAAALLFVATLTLTMGEMWGESAWWALRYGLAPDNAQGQYGAVFQLGAAVPMVVGPLLVTALTASLGTAGWLIIAVLFLAAMVVNRRLITHAEDTRQPALITQQTPVTNQP